MSSKKSRKRRSERVAANSRHEQWASPRSMTAEERVEAYAERICEGDIFSVIHKPTGLIRLPFKLLPPNQTEYRDSRGKAHLEVSIRIIDDGQTVAFWVHEGWNVTDWDNKMSVMKLVCLVGDGSSDDEKPKQWFFLDPETEKLTPHLNLPVADERCAPEHIVSTIKAFVGSVLWHDRFLRRLPKSWRTADIDTLFAESFERARQEDWDDERVDALGESNRQACAEVSNELCQELAAKLRQWERDNEPLPACYVDDTIKWFDENVLENASATAVILDDNRAVGFMPSFDEVIPDLFRKLIDSVFAGDPTRNIFLDGKWRSAAVRFVQQGS